MEGVGLNRGTLQYMHLITSTLNGEKVVTSL